MAMKELATIRIDAGAPRPATVNPYIFGHFVEDIRDHMDAMLAFLLKDMDFEEEAVNGVSAGWYPINDGKNTEFALEPAAPKHSGHSQRVRIYSADQCTAGIGQRVSVRGGMVYRFKIVARAALDIRELRCEIGDGGIGAVLCSAVVELVSHNWREYTVTLTPSQSVENAEFRLLISAEGASWRDSTASGTIWIDHVSALPADSVGIVRREVVEMTRALRPGMMRLSGNYISAYHFEHAIGPVLERPNMINEAWGGWTNKYFGTDEFLAFCRDVSVEPMICVNAGSGTPEEAVQWLEYCNGGEDTVNGALRAQHGHKDPYDVKYWEIGNEIYGPWQIGHCTAEEYAYRFLRFAKAMKASDPSIVLMACGETVTEWNSILLEIAGEYIDYITLHIYHGAFTTGLQPNTPKEERYQTIVSFPEVTRHIVEDAAARIRSSDKHCHVKLAITEYATMYYPNTIRKGLPMEHTLESAVANAANLNEYLRQSDIVEIGSYSDLVNGWLAGCIRVGDHYADQYRGKKPGWSGKSQVIYGTPTYHIMKLYASRPLSRVVPCTAECGTYTVTCDRGAYGLSVGDSLLVLDVVACLDESGDILTAFVVNRGLEPVEVRIDIEGFDPAPEVKLWEIGDDDYEAINSVFEPERIVSKEGGLSASSGGVGHMLPPHSVSVLELRRLR